MADDDVQRTLFVNGERLKRDMEKTPGGGGQKFHPHTAEEACSWLRPQAETLRESVRRIPDEHRGPRVLFQATLFPNYLAASYFPSQLLSELDLVPVGSRAATADYKTKTTEQADAPTKSLVLAGADASFDSFAAITQTGGTSGYAQAAVEQIRELAEVRLAAAEEVLGGRSYGTAGELLDLEAVLHPGADSRNSDLRPIGDETFGKWVAFVEGLDGRVLADYRRTVGGLTFVPIRLVDAAVPEVVGFNPLRAVRPLPAMRPIIPGLLRSTGISVDPPADPTPSTGAAVAIFDGGAETTAVLPACSAVDVTTEPADEASRDHGSGVTAAALYGNIKPGDALPCPSAEVSHYRVVPHPDAGSDPEVYWVLDQIERFVRTERPDIVNLSLGPNISVEDGEEPNRWTSTLDELAYKHEVLFIVAAGNNGDEDAATGLNRVQVPADMVNGLSVGACNRHHPEQPWLRTAYSAVGPGRAGNRVQPSGVQFGGDRDRPFFAVMPDGQLKKTCGTSFSAPLVTHSLARLGGLLGPDRTTPNNLRAFAVHLAERHDRHEEVITEVGHGRFEHDYEAALALKRTECMVLYEDRISRGETAALPLPVPEGIAHGMIELAWTIAVTSPTEPSQPLEYTRAAIEVVFRPHEHRYVMTKGTSRLAVDVSEDRQQIRSLYAKGYQLSSVPKSIAVPGSHGTETERRDSGKWETVRHYHKRFQASSLKNPQLELVYLAREGGLLAHTVPPLDYTLLASVSGPADSDLYAKVESQFTVLNKLRTGHIRINSTP